jgi:TonB family protein
MPRSIAAFLLTLFLAAPAWADLTIEQWQSDFREQVGSKWEPPVDLLTSLPPLPSGKDRYRIIVRARVDRKGRLLDARVQQPSGIAPLDKLAVETMQKAAPFKPLPSQLNVPDITVLFVFETYPQNTGAVSTPF